MNKINVERVQIKKDLDSKGFRSSNEMIQNIVELNHMTGKKNSVYEIAQAYKKNTYKDNPKIFNKVKGIGDELSKQERDRSKRKAKAKLKPKMKVLENDLEL